MRLGLTLRMAAWLLGVFVLDAAAPRAQTFPLFGTNVTWRYRKGTIEASSPDTTAWRQRAFADATWASGNAPFYYGETYLASGTVLTDMLNQYTTVFLRRPFVITNAAEIAELELTGACDDGYIAWINGFAVVNANGPAGEPLFNSLAPLVAAEPPPFVGNPIPNPQDFLVTGTNVLALQLFNVSIGSSDLVFDAALTATLKERADPRVVAVSPAPDSALAALTQVTVTFSEAVQGVDAADLWINETPCTGFAGSGATYTFTFAQPLYGTVQVSWDMRNGIADLSVPPNAFNPTGAGARWVYELHDPGAPKVVSLNPPAQAAVRQLRQVEVYFDRAVNGVDPGDLSIDGAAATNVTGVAAGPYVFEFPVVAAGAVAVRWAASTGIVDLSPTPHAFEGGSWSYTVNPQLVVPDILINEFMAENVSGLVDEDADHEDWIELYNRSDRAVNLAGWSLTDDPRLPGQWVFPAVSLPARAYLVVFASGKDRRSTAGGARLHTNFKLAITGEYLGLYNAESPRAAVSALAPEAPEQRNDVSYGRDALDAWRYFANGTPGAANGPSRITAVVAPVHFSAPRGYFARPFNLSLATATPGAAIRYTLDGSVPTLTNGIVYSNLIAINTTRVIRAAAFLTNTLPSKVTTHTYLFNQAPSRRYLPALSLVTATNNLYGKTGIMEYNPRNTFNHGIAWERPVSAEWIRPEDNGGFQVDCGLRIQGGGYIRGLYNYRSGSIPESKYSFRLYFRGDYGEGRLRYPLLPETPVDSFDTIVLRAGMNDATNPFLRDEFARRLESDVGQVASHGTFVQLFLNGVYKGYYNPTERIDDDFLRTWHGGTNEWDLIAMGGEIRSGDAAAWNAMRTFANNSNLLLPEKYLDLERRLDLTNFVEYLIPLIYGDTDDWPHNNWRAARERSPQGLFRFYAWDAEWSFGYNNSVNHNTIAAQLSNLGPPWGGTEIQTLFLRLKASPEFRLLFADRVHKHFFNDGAMTDARLKARYDWLKAMIAPSISGFDNSIGSSWIPNRRRYVTNHFGLAGLLSSSNAPTFNQFGGPVPRGFALTLSNGTGPIYYTTNGADPRVRFSGAVATDARAYTPGSAIVVDRSLLVRARSQWGTNWSAVTEAAFQVEEFGLPLRISEIMYHPPGGEAYEFIELQNVSAVPIDLSGVHLDGVVYRFAEGTQLAGGARLVLIPDANPAAFARRYPGVPVFGQYGGSLANGGERLALLDAANRTVVSVDYGDSGGWAAAADGSGRSLEIVDPYGDPNDPANWRASTEAGGSPGNAHPAPPLAVRLNEIAAGTVAVPGGLLPGAWCELYNPGPEIVALAGWTLSDGGPTRRFVFPPMDLAAGQYVLVYCDTNALPTGLHTGFGLDAHGDQLFLDTAGGERVDALSFGPQVAGFTLGRVGEALDWQLAEPTPGAPNAAAALGSPTSLAINETMANAPPGGDDWIELFNRDPLRAVALEGLVLGATNALFSITSLSFVAPGGFVLLRADEKPGADHVDFKLPAAAGYLALYDSVGRVLNALSYTNASESVSLGRLPDGHTNLVAFSLSASPGAPNYVADYRGVLLNEVLVRNVAATADRRGAYPAWIELVNPSTNTIDLAGLSLSVNERQPGQWMFPAGLTIGPGDYRIVWCDPSRPPSTAPELDLTCGRALAEKGGGVYLFAANGQVVDAVEYGFQLPDLSFGRANNGWSLLTAPTRLSSNAPPATLGDPANLRINEWMAGDEAADWLELHNLNPLPVNLGGLVLTDDPSVAGATNHVIRPLTFVAGRGWATWIADGDLDQGADHLRFSLDAQGETIRLYRASQTIVDSIDFVVQSPGVSEGRFPDGSTNIVRFPATASPDAANHLALEAVLVNEVLARAEPPLEPAIELLNATPRAVDIGGWWLSDDPTRLDKVRVPAGTVIPGHGFAVLYRPQFAPPAGGTDGFELNPWTNGTVILSETDAHGTATGYRSALPYGVDDANVSFGRCETSLGLDVVAQRRTTFGMDQPVDVAQFRTGQGARNSGPRLGPVVLSEVMYDPVSLTTAGLVEHPGAEFIELFNAATEPVDLFAFTSLQTEGWRLSGAVEFEFPAGTTLDAGGYLLVVGFNPQTDAAALAAFRTLYQLDPGVRLLGPFSGRLANEGERLLLERPLAWPDPPPPGAGLLPCATVEAIRYNDRIPWPPAARGTGRSLQRNTPILYGNEAMNWHAGWPTPGRDNRSVDPDADRDGLPDDWEILNGLDPYRALGADGPDGDPDNDGLVNRLEYASATDPHAKDLIVTGVSAAAGFLHLSFNAIAGRSYAVETRDGWETGDWTFWANVLPPTTSQIVELKYPLPAGQPSRYFRVRVQ